MRNEPGRSRIKPRINMLPLIVCVSVCMNGWNFIYILAAEQHHLNSSYEYRKKYTPEKTRAETCTQA